MSKTPRSKRLAFGAAWLLIASLVFFLFQNCSPFVVAPLSKNALSSSGLTDTMSAKGAIQLGQRVFSITPGDDLVVGKVYQLSSLASDYNLKLTSIPQAACSLSVSRSLMCSAPAVVNVTVEELNSRGQLITKHEAAYNAVDSFSLLQKGASVYSTNCASCHGPLATSEHREHTLLSLSDTMITAPTMVAIPALASLKFADLVALEVALSTSLSSSGQTLYKLNCSSCHGDIPNQQHRGATASQILYGIKYQAQMMKPSLMALSATEIDAIAAAMR